MFKKDNLYFGYGNIFEDFFTSKFDVIILNSCFQYFADADVLIERLKDMLTIHGEIHILDSPVYENNKKALEAKERTDSYYKKMEAPEMAENYFHHTKSSLKGFKTMYEPGGIIKKILGKKDIPFGWYSFIK